MYKKSELYTKDLVYNKLESDNKYALKSDIIDKTMLYTKDLVYSKLESDAKYALQSDVYSKAQSDARYASLTDLGNLYVKKIGDTLSGTLSFDKTVEKPIKGMFNDTDEYGIEINKSYKVMTIYNGSTAVGSSIRVYNRNGYADLINNLGNTWFTGNVRADKGFTIPGDDAKLTFVSSNSLSLVNKDYGLLVDGNGIKTKKMIIANPNNDTDNTNTMSVNTDGQIEINNTNGVKSQKFIGNLQGNADSATMINNTKLVFSNGTEMWIG